VAELVGGALYSTLTEQEKILINFGAEKTMVSVSDASRVIGKDWPTAKAILEGLVERRIFELRRRSGKLRESSKRYVLRTKGSAP
jgi:hypothetical protein